MNDRIHTIIKTTDDKATIVAKIRTMLALGFCGTSYIYVLNNRDNALIKAYEVLEFNKITSFLNNDRANFPTDLQAFHLYDEDGEVDYQKGTDYYLSLDNIADIIFNLVKGLPDIDMVQVVDGLKSFNSIEEARLYGIDFRKRQYETILVNGKKKILCGTDMAYEESIWGNVYDIIKTMYEKFATPEMIEENDDDECLLTDKTSEVRDSIIEWFEETMGVEFINVYDEY